MRRATGEASGLGPGGGLCRNQSFEHGFVGHRAGRALGGGGGVFGAYAAVATKNLKTHLFVDGHGQVDVRVNFLVRDSKGLAGLWGRQGGSGM